MSRNKIKIKQDKQNDVVTFSKTKYYILKINFKNALPEKI